MNILSSDIKGLLMNTSFTEKVKHIPLPTAMLVIQIALFFTIVFDIPVARQVIGFIYLTFVPGFAILRLLKLKLEIAERILFAAGLSIAFLMGVGFFTNLLGPLFGISKPLSLIPLMVVVNIIVLLFLFLEWRNHEVHAFSVGYKKLAAFGLVLCTILMLSVVGTLLVSIPPHNNNSILLFTLILISVLVGLAAFSKKLVSPEYYPLILFAIALALLLHVSLFTEYIHGGDVFGEYASFKLTLSNSYWDLVFSSRIYSMLSVTILPAIYSTILGLEGTWILKIVYPLILALVPVGLFQLFKTKFSWEVALFSVFFFISNLVFFTEIVVLARQIVGELFYILLFLTIFGNSVKGSMKWLCFCVFSFGLVVSHYAMSYIFLIFIFAFWLLSALRKRKTSINVGMLITFTIMTFAWYIYTSSSATFNDLVSMAKTIQTNFVSDFLIGQSRGSQVLQGTGLQSGLSTFWHTGGTYLFYATELLVVVGLLSLLLRQRRSFFNDEYNVMSFLNMALLVSCIVVPNLATSFNMSRFYQVSLFFLAPFCLVGGIDILRFLSRKRFKEKYVLAVVVLAVLVPFFLFQTDFVYEVTKEDSVSLPLSSYRFSTLSLARMGVIGESEVSGAMWLSQFSDTNRYVYADISSGAIFAYVGIQDFASISLGVPIAEGSCLYLREFNVLDGVVFSNSGYGSFNVTQIVPGPNETNLVYCSGSCETYEIP
jgi:uncharacterized membrane protein